MSHPDRWFSYVRFSAAVVASWLVVAQVVTPGGGSAAAAASAKFAQSTSAFVTYWQRTFASYDKTFPPPRIVPFENRLDGTACGTIPAGNAFFCTRDNNVYYDVTFLQTLSKDAGKLTGTDGDYAPIAAIGHELGHAVLLHLQPYATFHQGLSYRVDKNRHERLSDCLSGSATRSAEGAGLLDRTDVSEGLAMMEIIGTPELVRSPTLRAWIQRHAQEHPEPQVRADRFRAGYARGIAACGEVVNMLRAPAGRR